MRRTLTIVAPILLLTSACKPTIIETPEPDPPPASDPADDPLVEHAAVREAVHAYTDALAARDAEAASARVVPETFAFYDELRVAALRSPRAKLEAWDLLSVLMVLQIRALVPVAELEAVDGRGLFGVAVREGLVGEGVAGVNLDEVWLDDDRNAAQIRLDGAPIVWLRKVDGRWRIDIPTMIQLLGPAIEAQAREQVLADGKIRTAYTLLQLSSERMIETDVLDPPLPTDPAQNGD